jgi:ribosomal RNA assembly protein
MNGKTRRIIEELTTADVVVYGHTVGIIGTFEQADAARSAIQMLIEGSQHHSVYKFLAKKRRELKKQMLELWEKPPEEK